MSEDIAIACNLGAMSRTQLERYKNLKARLFASTEAMREIEDGLEFRFAISVLQETTEFILLEKLCCPFVDFSMHVPASGQHFYLRLSGRPEIRDFLKEQLFPSS